MPNTLINRRVECVSNTSFYPPVGGYKFWFRADGLVKGVTNGYGITDGSGNISQLTDLGGSNITATQAVGVLQPTLVENLIGAKNRKGIRFTNLALQTLVLNNALGLVNNVSGYTIFSVPKTTTGGSTEITIYWSTNASASSSRVDLRSASTDKWAAQARDVDSDAATSATGNTSLTNFKIVCAATDFSGGNIYEYENGSQVASAALLHSGNTSASNSAAAYIASLNGTSNYWVGDTGEFLVYNTKLSDTDIKATMTWLNKFYGIY